MGDLINQHIQPNQQPPSAGLLQWCFHRSSLALGYGRGDLKFNPVNGKWKFTPEYETLSHDNLPADAWIGFLRERKEKSSTRLDLRPFSVAEQEKILSVGACLTCHDNNSEVMRASLNSDFNRNL